MSRKVIMGLAAGLIALTALQTTAAEAKGKDFHFHGHGHGHGKHHKFVVYKWYKPHYHVSHGCEFYLWKWKDTGRFFWKKKYFACIY